MVTEEDIQNNSNLTEKEKELAILRVVNHKKYREIMESNNSNPTEISRAEKKALGKWKDDAMDQQSAINYSEMYRRFDNSQGPSEVAIALNLPIGLVTEEYIEYMEASKVPGFAQLYAELGYDSFRQLELIRESMKSSGYTNLKHAGKYVAKAEELTLQWNTGEILESKVRRMRGDLASMNKEKVARQKDIEELDKLEQEKSKKVKDFEDVILRLRKQNPNATAAEAAIKVIEEVLNDRRQVFSLEIESLLYGARSNFDLRYYIELFLFPDRRRDRVSDLQIMTGIMDLLPPIAQDVYDRWINIVKHRISQA